MGLFLTRRHKNETTWSKTLTSAGHLLGSVVQNDSSAYLKASLQQPQGPASPLHGEGNLGKPRLPPAAPTGRPRATSLQQARAFPTHPAPRGSPSSGYGNSFILAGTVALSLSSARIKQLQQSRLSVCAEDGQKNLWPLEPMGLSLLRIMPLVSVLQQKGLEFGKETLSGIHSIDDCNQAWQPLDLTALSGPNQRPLT